MSECRMKDMMITMREALGGISKNIFTTNRPKTVNDRMNDFLVISLPVGIISRTVGKGYGVSSTTARIEIYVRDVNSLEHLAKLDQMTNQVLDAFPISANDITLSRPRVVMTGEDKYGFHVVTIQSKLLTK